MKKNFASLLCAALAMVGRPPFSFAVLSQRIIIREPAQLYSVLSHPAILGANSLSPQQVSVVLDQFYQHAPQPWDISRGGFTLQIDAARMKFVINPTDADTGYPVRSVIIAVPTSEEAGHLVKSNYRIRQLTHDIESLNRQNPEEIPRLLSRYFENAGVSKTVSAGTVPKAEVIVRSLGEHLDFHTGKLTRPKQEASAKKEIITKAPYQSNSLQTRPIFSEAERALNLSQRAMLLRKSIHDYFPIIYSAALLLFGIHRVVTMNGRYHYYHEIAVAIRHGQHAPFTLLQKFNLGGLNDFLTIPCLLAFFYFMTLLDTSNTYVGEKNRLEKENFSTYRVAFILAGVPTVLFVVGSFFAHDLMNAVSYGTGGLLAFFSCLLGWFPKSKSD